MGNIFQPVGPSFNDVEPIGASYFKDRILSTARVVVHHTQTDLGRGPQEDLNEHEIIEHIAYDEYCQKNAGNPIPLPLAFASFLQPLTSLWL